MKKIGLSYRKGTALTYKGVLMSLEEAGAEPIPLPLVRCPELEYDEDRLKDRYITKDGYLSKEAADIVKNYDTDSLGLEKILSGLSGIVFPGGECVSPTLLTDDNAEGCPEHDYDPTRDVSDYLLMRYSLDHDYHILSICRGMQVLGAVSGASIIPDLGEYFAKKGIEYDDSHREKPGDNRDFASHDIKVVDKDSILYKIYGTTIIGKMPSWHHQSLKSVDNTKLKVTAITETLGENLIEAVERMDKSYVIGIQTHPEMAIRKEKEEAPNRFRYLPASEALKLFSHFIAYSPKK